MTRSGPSWLAACEAPGPGNGGPIEGTVYHMSTLRRDPDMIGRNS